MTANLVEHQARTVASGPEQPSQNNVNPAPIAGPGRSISELDHRELTTSREALLHFASTVAEECPALSHVSQRQTLDPERPQHSRRHTLQRPYRVRRDG